ncbi:hypothetical protein A3G63_00350 [Candidatus Kaiserbacteria bacterium RIFCSPLOWO2_12_FULL_52_8]|uniref:Uncharacterized protein n=1 Tax=Candidatus Kaiserbacteria bacterium RIFCSPHIGHO2_01_FULL_53_31 TaxID=1798481 RepID=A0A1F6CHC7_9BACT|nr:MAG: hypothetical protein A2678_02240 [Candidatus Kaiserbacteria bacterium RIFCSPHIGHO2_01_FULL_53_31]OGG92611.1 MAG: hypothetical protein A3G63_00350 [Candidatus Kaiserbacteria bacterium RIFCSPLOWO2_12_FULL_52_8]
MMPQGEMYIVAIIQTLHPQAVRKLAAHGHQLRTSTLRRFSLFQKVLRLGFADIMGRLLAPLRGLLP